MSEPNQDEQNENDIAIVGMALRVPGARNPREFWKNLREGVESISFLSDEFLLAHGVAEAKLRKPNYVRAASILDDMELFDGEFFGMSPKESAIMDPQHRHFLECAWEALEDAGHPPDTFDGPIGVYAGCGMGSYFYFNVCSHRELVDSVGMFLLRHTGNDKDFLATRVSYTFDLHGPSINVQTACSTSLVAVHFASQSLLSRECDMALAGGVTIELPHRRGYLFEEGEILSPTGHCHAFDHRAQGTVFGSGAGVVVLRRLEDALRDGDQVYAVIKGSAINNDGAGKVGYLAPSVDGQAGAMVEAYTLADVDASTIDYVECHGTGTYMGDPIEVAALTQAFRQATANRAMQKATGYCRIGSVKTNIGHLDTAAGVASLVKASLALHHREMPPSLNFEAPNPTIDFASSPFVVNDRLTPWPRKDHPRRAAVNSLGVGGTNAHVVIEEAPEPVASSSAKRRFQLLQVSGRTRGALDANAARLADYLEAHGDVPLADVAYTLHHGRRAFDRRRVVAAQDHAEAVRLLREQDPRRVFSHVKLERPRVAFMFPGGGAQYVGMGRGLYATERVFRDVIDRGLEILRPKIDYDPRAVLFAEGDARARAADIFETPSVQLPAILIVEVALARLFESWGLVPDALIGHSMGENTAAHVAGVLSYEDAIGLVHFRGKLMDGVPRGGMLSVPLPAEELVPLLGDELDLASVNSPSLSVASGPSEALDRLAKSLAERGIEAQRVRIHIAAHSRLLDGILEPWRAHLRTLRLSPPKIPIVSNFTGTWLTDAQATDPEYWVSHLRNAVRFGDGVRALVETPGRVLVEVGPGRTLGSLAKQSPGVEPQAVVSALRHPDEDVDDGAHFATVLGRLWGLGVSLEHARRWEGETRRRVSLPTYAFQHQHYFIEPAAPRAPAEEDARPVKRAELEQWGYRPSFRRKPAEPLALERALTWLLFVDDAGVGERLRARFEARGHIVVTVHPGDAYHRRSEVEYALSPERGREGYDALLRDLVASGRVPSRIVHLWTLTADESFRPGSSFFHRNLERGFFSLFFLAQSLSDDAVPKPIHLTVVANGMQKLGGEPLRYPEKATVLGAVRVMPREIPGVTASSIDLVLPEARERLFGGRIRMALADPFAGKKAVSSGLDAVVDLLEEDLLSEPENVVAAHRDGKRYELRYEPHPLRDVGPGVRAGAVVVITGGLGGLGLTIAEYLARTSKAKVVLVSRSGLPPRDTWDATVRRRGEADATSRRIERVRRIESLGGEVEVVAADVTNLEDMRRVAEVATARFGAVHGVVHTAGVVKDDLLVLKTEADVEEVFTPKVHGTLVLDEVFGARSLDFFVLFASTSAITAPVGQIDYAAANAFLDAFAASRDGSSARRVVAIDWGIWNEVGIAARAFGRGAEADAVERVDAAHPLYDARERDARGQLSFVARYSPSTHWFLDEHRTLAGHAIVPGTGYLELARGALLEQGEREQAFAIEDLFFIRPLYVPDASPRDVRVTLRRNEGGYAFEVRSRREVNGKRGYELHAQANVALLPLGAPARLDLAAVMGRTTVRHEADPKGLRTPQENFLRFGPRWRVLRDVRWGHGEALARLELPSPFAGDVAQFGLHPALLDLATGFAMELIDGYVPESLWVPVSYRRVRVHAPLPARIVSHVRVRARSSQSSGFAAFDVALADESGRVFVEIEEFSIKRLGETVDFGVTSDPSPRDFEPEIAASARDLSPAEEQLRSQLDQGILPDEGAAAFGRVLGGEPLPEVVVSSMDLGALVAQAARSAAAAPKSDDTKFARPELESEYVEPRDDLERTLVAYFEELLGVDRVGIRDSFFDLGGHSLIAVRLFAKIKKAYQVDFPISVLFEAPTVERCAALVREARGEEPSQGGASEAAPSPAAPRVRYTHLVAMHPGEGGPKTPFFLVAGMFGNVLNLRHLASFLGTERRFYGLQARGLYGGEKPHETFDEMAAAYIAEMRTVQARGPYLLGGFSGGGITALEIAQRLLADGEEIGLLVFLDTPLPHGPSLTPRDRALIQLTRLKRQGPGYLGTWAKNRLEWEMGKLRARFEDADRGRSPEEFHNDEIEQAFRRALARYEVRHYPGRIVLFRPRLDESYVLGAGRVLDRHLNFVFPDNDWGRYADSIEVHEVPGDHDSMVLEPNVRVLGARLRAAIEAAERGEGVVRARSREAAE